MAVLLGLVFVLTGCAVFVRDEDGYHHHYRYHHGHHDWERGSLQPSLQFTDGTLGNQRLYVGYQEQVEQ